MTISEKIEIIKAIGALFTAIIGVIFLIWRAISNDRIAKAALKQADVAYNQLKISNKSIELQLKQVDSTAKQIELLSKNTEISISSFEESIKKNQFDAFSNAMDNLSKADNDLQRISSITVIGEIALRNPDFLISTLSTFEHYARTISPSRPIDTTMHKWLYKEKEYSIKNEDDIKQIIIFLKAFPLSFWIDIKYSLKNLNPYGILQEIDENNITEKNKEIIKPLWDFIIKIHPFRINRFLYHHTRKNELQTMIDMILRIKIKYPEHYIPLSQINLDGYNFITHNLSYSYLMQSTMRGCDCYQTNFENANILDGDFSAAFLTESNFTNADLSGCDFSNSCLEGAIFDNANIDNCLFKNCLNIEKAHIGNAINKDNAIFM